MQFWKEYIMRDAVECFEKIHHFPLIFQSCKTKICAICFSVHRHRKDKDACTKKGKTCICVL